MWAETWGRTFVLANFTEAFAFMTREVIVAERLDHHPEWSNLYNRVRIVLTIHDAGNTVTERDRPIAAELDALARPTR